MDKFEDKKKIIDSISSPTPRDLSGKIKNIYLAEQKEKKAKKRIQTKVWGPVFGTAFGALLVIAVAVPLALQGDGAIDTSSTTGGTSHTSQTNLPPLPVFNQADSEQIAYCVASANNILGQNGMNPVQNLIKRRALPENDKNIIQGKLTNIHPYVVTGEAMLNNNFALTSTLTQSGRDDYPYLMTIVDGEEMVNFYFKETLKEQEDDEQEFHIQGEITVHDETYMVIGEKELEVGEYEIEFRIYFDENNLNQYLLIEEETEKEEGEVEISYSYSYVGFGETKIIEVNYEAENNEKAVELLYEQGNTKDEYRLYYSRNSVLTLEMKSDDYELTFKVENVIDQGIPALSYILNSDPTFSLILKK